MYCSTFSREMQSVGSRKLLVSTAENQAAWHGGENGPDPSNQLWASGGRWPVLKMTEASCSDSNPRLLTIPICFLEGAGLTWSSPLRKHIDKICQPPEPSTPIAIAESFRQYPPDNRTDRRLSLASPYHCRLSKSSTPHNSIMPHCPPTMSLPDSFSLLALRPSVKNTTIRKFFISQVIFSIKSSPRTIRSSLNSFSFQQKLSQHTIYSSNRDILTDTTSRIIRKTIRSIINISHLRHFNATALS